MRRRGGGLVAVVAGCLLLVTACTPPGLPEPIAPSGPSVLPGAPPPAGTVVIGMDGTNGPVAGFNPYAVADFSSATQAVASLILPSPFVRTASGTLKPDGDLIEDALVTSKDPFIVTYTLDREASWSDGTPVTAEDFSYLWSQMLVQPGTVDPAGYQLIEAVRSRDAGKTVEVQFSAPFPDWRTLFSPLLPSHLMKVFPGGWSAALGNDLPVSANQYRMTSYDAVTGQIELARNDKYWAAPPGPAAVVLRLGEPGDLLGSFKRGDVQALWLAADGATAESLRTAVPADRRVIVPEPVTIQLIFNTVSGATADRNVRAAIAAVINQPLLAVDLTGGWLDGGSAVGSQVQLPSQGAQRSPPAPVGTGDMAAAASALTAAGYTGSGLYVAKAGQVLRLTLGYPSGDPRLAAAARSIQRQLGSVGIEVDLLADAPTTLINSRIATGTTDLGLIAVPRGSSDAASAASAFGCPADGPVAVGSTASATATPTVGAGEPPTTTPPPTTIPAPTGRPAPTATVRMGNLSGYCDLATQVGLATAISGAGSVDVVDSALWRDLPVFPLLQQSTVFAVSESLRSVLDSPHQGWTWTGPLSGLSEWPV